MWRPKTDIDGHVQDFALDDSAQLSLWSIQLVMKTTQCAPGGTRVVVLHEVIGDTEGGKLGLVIAFQEKAASVEKHLGLNQTHAGKGCLETFQCNSLPQSKAGGPSSVSAQPGRAEPGSKSTVGRGSAANQVEDLAPPDIMACNDKSRFS